MSVFADQFAAQATPQRLDQFGESIRFTPAGGDNVWMMGIVTNEPSVREDRGRGVRTWHSAQVIIADDADTGDTSPEIGDQIYMNGREYRIIEAPDRSTAGEWAFRVECSQDGEQTAPDMREDLG